MLARGVALLEGGEPPLAGVVALPEGALPLLGGGAPLPEGGIALPEGGEPPPPELGGTGSEEEAITSSSHIRLIRWKGGGCLQAVF